MHLAINRHSCHRHEQRSTIKKIPWQHTYTADTRTYKGREAEAAGTISPFLPRTHVQAHTHMLLCKKTSFIPHYSKPSCTRTSVRQTVRDGWGDITAVGSTNNKIETNEPSRNMPVEVHLNYDSPMDTWLSLFGGQEFNQRRGGDLQKRLHSTHHTSAEDRSLSSQDASVHPHHPSCLFSLQQGTHFIHKKTKKSTNIEGATSPRETLLRVLLDSIGVKDE